MASSYYLLRRYAEVAAVLDRALTIKPDDLETRVERASVELDWKADPHPMHEAVDFVRNNNPAKLSTVADSWFMAKHWTNEIARLPKALW